MHTYTELNNNILVYAILRIGVGSFLKAIKSTNLDDLDILTDAEADILALTEILAIETK